MVVRFIRAYGASAYWNQQHPTEDGVIPWRMFLLLYARLPEAKAEEKLTGAEAVSTAIALTMDDGSGEGRKQFQSLIQQAYPEEA